MALLLAACGTPAVREDNATALLIAGAQVIDGSGAPAVAAGVRVADGRIQAVGDLEPLATDRVVDARGMVLAPGFIDTHSHADAGADLADEPQAVAAVSQGITTVVVGQDGESPYPLAEFFGNLEAAPVAVNVASYAGHNTLRGRVLGDDFRRTADAAEVERMGELLERELAAGALGLSTGLEYDPGIYSDTAEVLALAHRTAAAGGRYISHVRSEDRYFWAAIEELLTIGREAGLPVQISHLKLAIQSNLGQTERLLRLLDEARAEGIEVTADLYPYTYWQSSMTVLFPERDYEDRAAAVFALEELSTPRNILLASFAPDPSLAGKTLAEIAALRSLDPPSALLGLIREAEALRAATGKHEVESVIAVSMDERDIEQLMRWPQLNFCTDGALRDTHPRGFGSFPRVLGRFVRQRGILSLEEAVHRMTARAAASMGFTDRGLIRPQMAADLVLFDPQAVLDHATTEDPQVVSTGILKVWVGGDLVYDQGLPTGRAPGKVLRGRPPESQSGDRVMAEMGKYCKAYLAKDFGQFSGWSPNLANLRQEQDDEGQESAKRTELKDDDILYLQENYVVTDGIFKDENIIFDDITDEWKKFCEGTLEFEIPVYEPIEIAEPEAQDSESN